MGVTGWLVLLQLGHELGESLVPLRAQVFPFQLHAETEDCTEHTPSNSKQKYINLSHTCHCANSVSDLFIIYVIMLSTEIIYAV
jgi:hypothetical protein